MSGDPGDWLLPSYPHCCYRSCQTKASDPADQVRIYWIREEDRTGPSPSSPQALLGAERVMGTGSGERILFTPLGPLEAPGNQLWD